MKKNYTMRTALLCFIAAFCFLSLTAQENVRILRVDPATNSVTLKNFGDAAATVSGYWFCVRPAYAQLNGMTSVATLAPDEELNVASSVNLVASSGEFALYSSSSFGSSAAILDFLQWGNGAGSSRESVAVAAGLWDANTFISAAPPYEYSGDGSQNGVTNWVTLSTNDFETQRNVTLYPNPATTDLNVAISNATSNGTIEVHDVLGKRIFSQAITNNNDLTIDIADWNNGIYLIKVATENGVSTKRFVKN